MQVALLPPTGAPRRLGTVARVAVEAPPRRFDVPPMDAAEPYQFGRQVALLGYDVGAASPGRGLRVVLYWRAIEDPADRLTAFVHVIDVADRLVAQVDAEPGGGAHPTSEWVEGEVVADERTIPLPADLAAGRYRLRIGWYRRAGPADPIVPVSAARGGQPLGDYVIMSSVGVTNPPAFVYLIAIPYLFTGDPGLATGFLGLLNVVATGLTALFGSRYFGRGVGAALLYATSPWLVVFNRKMQAQDVVSFFALLLMLAVFGLIVRRQQWQFLLIGVWLSFLIQLHLSGFALGAVLLLVLLLYRRRVRLAWLLGGAAAGIVLFVPYVIAQFQFGWADIRQLLKLARQPAVLELESLRWLWEMVAIDAFPGLTGAGYDRYAPLRPPIDPALQVLGLVFLASLGYLVVRLARAWRHGRAGERDALVLLLLWLLGPPLFFFRHTMPLYPHYLLVAFPAPFVTVGLLVADATTWIWRRAAPAGTAREWRRLAMAAPVAFAFAALLTLELESYRVVMDYVGRAATSGWHGVPLREYEKAVDRAVARAAVESTKPLQIAAGGDVAPAALVFLVRGRQPVRVFDDRTTLIFPPADDRPTVYLIGDPTRPPGRLFAERFATARTDRIPHPGDVSAFEVYRLPPDAAGVVERLGLDPLSGTFASGVELLGVGAPKRTAAGDALEVLLAWRLGSGHARPPDDFAFFVHLRGAGQRRVAQADLLGYPVDQWQAGATVLQWHTLDLPPDLHTGPYDLVVGMYRQGQIERVPIALADGRRVDELRTGSVKVLGLAGPPPEHRQAMFWQNDLVLEGFTLPPILAPGATVPVQLHWRARSRPVADRTVFVHLLDQTGRLVAQHDGPPQLGSYPLTLWEADEPVVDEHPIALPADLSPGSYRLFVGQYDPKTLTRVPLASQADALELDVPLVVRPRP